MLYKEIQVKGGNDTLDQVSLCTLGRRNNMAPRLRAPCSVGRQSSSRSLSHISLSHHPLILICSDMPFALYDPLVCSTPPHPQTLLSPLKYSFNIRSSALISSVYLGTLLQLVVASVCSRPSVQTCVCFQKVNLTPALLSTTEL